MTQTLKKKKKQEVSYHYTDRINKQVISEILEVEKTRGLTADNLLDKARSKNSSLHKFFDWNDTSAANNWRRFQARLLINQVKLTIGEKQLFAFENVSVSINENDEENGTQRQYKRIVEILNNDDYKKQQLEVALANLTYWQQKYSDLRELKPIFKVLGDVKKKWQRKRQ